MAKGNDEVLKDGEPWLLKYDEVHHIECCDCGLVHAFYIRPTADGVTITHYRDEHRTEIARKEKGVVMYYKKRKNARK